MNISSATKSLTLSVLMITTSLIVTIALAEVVAIVLGFSPAGSRFCPGEMDNRKSTNFVADSKVGWKMYPSNSFSFTTEGVAVDYSSDEEGFRTSEFSRPPIATPSAKVFVSGDSYAWGFGVEYENSLTGLLEKSLPTVSFRNAAMPGFGLDQIWRSLIEFGLPTKPDAVVITIYPDDLERCMTAYRIAEGLNKPAYKVDGDKLVVRSQKDCPTSGFRFLEEYSRLFGLYRRATLRLGRDYGIGKWWELNEAILDGMVEATNKADIPILFVHIPFQTWKPFNALDQYMAKNKAEYLNLYEVMGDEWAKYYFQNDGHLNRKGHKFLSSKVREWLETKALD